MSVLRILLLDLIIWTVVGPELDLQTLQIKSIKQFIDRPQIIQSHQSPIIDKNLNQEEDIRWNVNVKKAIFSQSKLKPNS